MQFDSLERKITTESTGFNGQRSFTLTTYDSVGRVDKEYRPFLYADGPGSYTQTTYDADSRVASITYPNNRKVVVNYNGLTVTKTETTDQTVVTKITDALGRTASVTDASGKTITYKYDPYDNLLQTSDSVGNKIVAQYDTIGHKVAMQDPDLGNWTYGYNCFGELVQQTDAKSQQATMAYDALGRLIQRTEPEGTTTWIYDSAFKGKLYKVSGPNFTRESNFDYIGHVRGSTITIGSRSFSILQEYDSQGRPFRSTDPAGLVLTREYDPNYGNLLRVKGHAANESTDTVYWEEQAENAAGQVTLYKAGNGVVTSRQWDANTGAENTNNVSNANGTGLQSMVYTWDPLGNLKNRADQVQGVSEDFTYDNLYRVKTSHVNTSQSGVTAALTDQSFTYDDVGNIVTKSGYGSYSYASPGHAHAVSSVLGSTVNSYYDYDANGSMTLLTEKNAQSGGVNRKRFTNWTSFNKVSGIIGEAQNEDFAYGPDRELIAKSNHNAGQAALGNSVAPNGTSRASANDVSLFERFAAFLANFFHTHPDAAATASAPSIATDSGAITTYYVGGDYEQVENYGTGVVTQQSNIGVNGAVLTVVKKTVPSGTAANGVAAVTNYLNHDHLGSVSMVTDSTGAVIERMSYDTFGRKRQSTWLNTPTTSNTSANTDRGYSGHIQLDNAALVNMGGRIYDAALGRFISADPTVAYPDSTQGLNRYSYTDNNPISRVDPSGFSWWNPHPWHDTQHLFQHTGVFGQILGIVVVAVASYYLGAYGSALASNFVTRAQGGTPQQGLRAGAVAFATSEAFAAVGAADTGNALQGWQPSAVIGRFVVYGTIGGLSSMAMGGTFRSGFIAGGITGVLNPAVGTLAGKNVPEGTLISALIGGTAAELSGGKFANGAMTAAFSYLATPHPDKASPESAASNQQTQGPSDGGGFQNIGFWDYFSRHDYSIGPFYVCADSALCRGVMADVFSYYIVPNLGDAVTNNSINPVYPFPNAGPNEWIGHVLTIVYDNGLSATNYTLNDHVLRWGQVDISNRLVNGAWYVYAHGYGSNAPGVGWVNQRMGPSIFNSQLSNYASQVQNVLRAYGVGR